MIRPRSKGQGPVPDGSFFRGVWLPGLLLLGGCGIGNEPAAGPGVAPQVVVTEVGRKPVRDTLSIVGSISANEQVEIQAEVDGLLEEVFFQEGQQVNRGDLLFQLDESKFASALGEAEANLRLSQATHERNRQLFSESLISRQEYDQSASTYAVHQATVELRQRQVRDTRIHAPFSGIVGARRVSPGQVISKNTVLTWLMDLDPVKAEFSVAERFVSRLQPGQVIEIKVAAYPGRMFPGDVFFVSPHMDPSTRSALVKAQVANPEFVLKSGMFANLDLILDERQSSVVIPEVGISRFLDGNRGIVYLVNDAQTVEARRVEFGVWGPGEVEILDGLEGGERLIVGGVQKVGPGATVRLAPPEAAAVYLGLGQEDQTAPLNRGRPASELEEPSGSKP